MENAPQGTSCTCCSKCCGGFKAIIAIVLLLVGLAAGFFVGRCGGKGMMCHTMSAPAASAPAAPPAAK